MRAYEVGDFASTRTVRLVERKDPAPNAGEVLVRVRSTGPNARDFAIMATGIYKGPAPAHRIPLCDMAGEVVSIGEGVTSVRPGDRVTMTHYWRWLDGAWDVSMREEDYAQTLDGFLRELAVVPAEALIKMPDELTFEQVGTLPSAGLTAWQAIVEAGRTKAGDVVVTIGTGGVSVFAMQWAKMLGARVIVTSSSDEKLERMKALGADDVINYRTTPKWHEAVMALTDGRGADVVVNNVGIAELDGCLESCASGGRIMFIGASPVSADREATDVPAPRRLGLLIIRDLTIKGVVVGSRKMFTDMLAKMVEHNIRPVIDRVFPFEQANEALAYAAKGDKIGKVVIRV